MGLRDGRRLRVPVEAERDGGDRTGRGDGEVQGGAPGAGDGVGQVGSEGDLEGVPVALEAIPELSPGAASHAGGDRPDPEGEAGEAGRLPARTAALVAPPIHGARRGAVGSDGREGAPAAWGALHPRRQGEREHLPPGDRLRGLLPHGGRDPRGGVDAGAERECARREAAGDRAMGLTFASAPETREAGSERASWTAPHASIEAERRRAPPGIGRSIAPSPPWTVMTSSCAATTASIATPTSRREAESAIVRAPWASMGIASQRADAAASIDARKGRPHLSPVTLMPTPPPIAWFRPSIRRVVVRAWAQAAGFVALGATILGLLRSFGVDFGSTWLFAWGVGLLFVAAGPIWLTTRLSRAMTRERVLSMHEDGLRWQDGDEAPDFWPWDRVVEVSDGLETLVIGDGEGRRLELPEAWEDASGQEVGRLLRELRQKALLGLPVRPRGR